MSVFQMKNFDIYAIDSSAIVFRNKTMVSGHDRLNGEDSM